MASRRKNPPGYMYLLILSLLIIGVIFLFHWLGGEKPQRLIDQPLELPERYQTANPNELNQNQEEGPGAI